MKLCADHWTRLKTAIELRGLLKLSSGSSAEAISRLEKTGENPRASFDPLLDACLAIYAQFMNDVGPVAALTGEICPLCSVESYNINRGQNWIDGASDDQYNRAKALGLLGEPT